MNGGGRWLLLLRFKTPTNHGMNTERPIGYLVVRDRMAVARLCLTFWLLKKHESQRQTSVFHRDDHGPYMCRRGPHCHSSFDIGSSFTPYDHPLVCYASSNRCRVNDCFHPLGCFRAKVERRRPPRIGDFVPLGTEPRCDDRVFGHWRKHPILGGRERNRDNATFELVLRFDLRFDRIQLCLHRAIAHSGSSLS